MKSKKRLIKAEINPQLFLHYLMNVLVFAIVPSSEKLRKDYLSSYLLEDVDNSRRLLHS